VGVKSHYEKLNDFFSSPKHLDLATIIGTPRIYQGFQ